MSIDGVARTEVNSTYYETIKGGNNNYLCSVQEFMDGEVELGNEVGRY